MPSQLFLDSCLTETIKDRLDGLFRKAFKPGLCSDVFRFNDLMLEADTKLFCQASDQRQLKLYLICNRVSMRVATLALWELHWLIVTDTTSTALPIFPHHKATASHTEICTLHCRK